MPILIITGWILYFAVHSILAADSVKLWCKERLPSLFRYYRIIYNLIAISGLLILLRITTGDTQKLIETGFISNVLAGILSVAGFSILIISFATFDKMEFLGLKEHKETLQSPLVTAGIYHYIRHPLYSGTILLAIALFLTLPTLSNALFLILTAVYIEIGSRLEERKLTQQFGTEYTSYARKVKCLIPFIY